MKLLKHGMSLMLFLFAIKGYSKTPDENSSSPWQLNASYKGDFVSNLSGGIKQGSAYLGLADLFVYFDTENAGLWRGGKFLVHGANSHGGEPSANLIGDFQVVSNIEAGDHTFLYELWYQQTLGKLNFTIGLQDMNVEFASSDIAADFINSSFGIHSVIADNIAAPIFPLTSPGITFGYNINQHTCIKTAVYKGCPINFEANPHNLKWKLNHLKGLLLVAEGQFKWTSKNEHLNTLKAGAFYHHHCPDNEVVSVETGNQLQYDYGFYMVGDHELFNNGHRGLSLFYQLGASPRNDNFGYLGAGCLYTGLLSAKGTDELGLALARGLLTKERGKDETTIEFTYKVQISEQIYLQPDVQHVIHPAGTETQLNNATVALLRLGLEF